MTRYIKSILCVMAVLGASSSALAQIDVPLGTAYFVFTNWDNGDDNYQGPNFTSPSATTDGALWIQTSTAAPVWLQQDVNMQLNWRPTPTSPWTTITTLLLQPPAPPTTFTVGSAFGDVAGNGSGYPGYWYDQSGQGNPSQPLPQSNYNCVDASGKYPPVAEYWLPGTSTIDRADWTQFQFELSAWTGTATTFPAAVAAGAQVADSGAFFANPGTDAYSPAGYAIDAIGDINPLNLGAFYYMPAVVLKTSLSGDANLDGKVDINDLTIVLAHYGQTGMSWRQGAMDGDPTGKVDINDLTIVLAHYGATAAASGPAVASAVPEPSALLLAAAALAGCLAYAGRNIGADERPAPGFRRRLCCRPPACWLWRPMLGGGASSFWQNLFSIDRRWIVMKLLAAIFGAVAIAGFAARSLAAPDNYFVPDNFYNAYACYPQIPYDNPGTYYATLPNGPVATEDGLVWLNTGSGPALKGGDLAVSIYYENTSSAWQLEETMFTSGGYSGYFMATNKPTWGNARVITNPLIVGSETIPVSGSQGDETFQQGLFYLQFWTDPALESTGKSAYSTYAQAYAASETGAAGVYVAQTAQFKVDFGFDDAVLYANEMGMYMPAVVLKAAFSPGDANGDGKVDINDLTVVLSHFGESGMTWSQGEFTGDGTVDINDLTIVLANFGRTAAARAGGTSVVAEPATLLLTAAGLLGLLAACVWRKRT